MSKYTYLFNSEEVGEIAAGRHAMLEATENKSIPAASVNIDTLAVAQDLLVRLPEVTFTFEVDIVGRHRITVHFGGGSVAVDE